MCWKRVSLCVYGWMFWRSHLWIRFSCEPIATRDEETRATDACRCLAPPGTRPARHDLGADGDVGVGPGGMLCGGALGIGTPVERRRGPREWAVSSSVCMSTRLWFGAPCDVDAGGAMQRAQAADGDGGYSSGEWAPARRVRAASSRASGQHRYLRVALSKICFRPE